MAAAAPQLASQVSDPQPPARVDQPLPCARDVGRRPAGLLGTPADVPVQEREPCLPPGRVVQSPHQLPCPSPQHILERHHEVL